MDKPAPLDTELVNRFVVAGHADLDAVREMLADRPSLVNATWDWGGGDWETALGGASHMGRSDIAGFLLAAGARMDIFCATMLGLTDIVMAMIAADGRALTALGPHGIGLVQHAEAGGGAGLAMRLRELGAS
ncbi:MAG: ankyrin repeat domain-containing protein [Actinomycetota bacterium]|nr:ankyrin repeat domain-containing protein [Actinomycetota bacterium]